ncbi:MAG: class I SAM-dependent methyltransferase [Anaerolineales bacterium]|nr:class I SAM-dependent methyltransferase [Anaerolineales bacterium]
MFDWYDRVVLPRVINIACSGESTVRQRQKVVPLATGRILEIGLGSGKNLAHYDPNRVEKFWGLDPSKELLAMAAPAVAAVPFAVELLHAGGEQIPLEDNSCDTVLSTYTLCSIPNLEQALKEIGRVLKPGGQFLFCEHGASPDKGVRWWQDQLTPVWSTFGGGCHLNREIPHLLEAAGFKLGWVEQMYIPGWRFATFNYWGSASCTPL